MHFVLDTVRDIVPVLFLAWHWAFEEEEKLWRLSILAQADPGGLFFVSHHLLDAITFTPCRFHGVSEVQINFKAKK